MKNENSKRKYGHGENRKNSQVEVRITQYEDDKLHHLTHYLSKSKSDVMRDALNRLYDLEGGDDIRNRPPKNSIGNFNLSKSDLEVLNSLSQESGESQTEIIRKAITLFKTCKETYR